MRRARVAALLVVAAAAAAAAVVWSTQPRARPVAGALPLGAEVGTLDLVALDGSPRPFAGYAEHAATVVWFWSVLCPCVEDCEERLRALTERYGPRGVRLLVAHPVDTDSADDIEAKRARLGSPYVVHRDPGGRLARRLGITASGSVVVIDREGRLRYRGAFDDDLYAPKVPHLANALDALLAGRAPALAEAEPTYGCLYRR